MKTETLYDTKDVKRVREKLFKEQGGVDLITQLPIPEGQAVLDHNHKTQYVRGVLHRQSNAVLGKLENLWTRYLSWWYNGTLSTFLRRAADYLEQPDDKRYVHPGWIKKVNTSFNKLNATEQNKVLRNLKFESGSNPANRKKLFNQAIKSKQFTYDQALKALNSL